MGLSTISRAKRDQTWREDVVTNGIGRVEGIAVDWIAGKVVWSWNHSEITVQEGRDARRGTGNEVIILFISFLQETSIGQTRVLMSLRWPGSMVHFAMW